MKKRITLIVMLLSFSLCLLAQSEQKGPFTVTVLSDGVYNIEDSNDSNPSGHHMDENGKEVDVNNCSDMYLVVGMNKAMLIDLSNKINWDDSATESLRSIVYNRVGDKQLYITITHRHSDHMGMLPAFLDDVNAKFWLCGEEFESLKSKFPAERTTYFAQNASFDLGGGFLLNTFEVAGHTEHGTLFFLKDKNIVFTGDALGSGSGVYLRTYEGFFSYAKSIDNLIKYIEEPTNGIDKFKLAIYGGHAWQRTERQLEELTGQYIYDMNTLIKKMCEGTAKVQLMTTRANSFLDSFYTYGTATIAWNKEAGEKLLRH